MLAQLTNPLARLHRSWLRWFKGSFLKTMFDRYHPEQHYMRGGSGPKCRSKDAKQNARSE
jgi:hypothetical protein